MTPAGTTTHPEPKNREIQSGAQREKTTKPILRIASLFSGIGGFELGFQRAGHRTQFMCDIDPHARAVLNKRFPGVPVEHDIRLLGSLPADCNVVTAGFPCQNLSQAGSLGGIFGSKSGLVWEAIRLLQKNPVPTVVIENVPFMLSLEKGNAIHSLVAALETIGYMWAYRVVDSRAFGTPQRRRRVILVATEKADPRQILLADDAIPKSINGHTDGKAYGFYWTEGNTGLGLVVDAIPPLKPGSTLGLPAAPAILLPNGKVVTPTISDAERLQGFPAGWTACAVRCGTCRGPRWRLVGNSVNVRLTAWIGRRLVDPKSYDAKGDTCLQDGAPWPTAAYNIGVGRIKAAVGEYPVAYNCPPIAEFLSSKAENLSIRATAGFVKRLKSSRLKYPVEFLGGLENHLARSKAVD